MPQNATSACDTLPVPFYPNLKITMNKYTSLLLTLFISIGSTHTFAQRNFDKVEIETTELRNGLYMLKGAGGNIAISIGADGVLMVDDQFAEMTAKIDAAIGTLSDKSVRYVLNTHWHFDHTGGNEHYHGQDGTIIAHDNTRERMSTDQVIEAFNMQVPASPKNALPVVTFNDTATVHFNQLTVELTHIPDAHTDTDAFVNFKEANVIHTGDVYISNSYLFIDTSSGGTLKGVINAFEKLITMSDDDTIIIPGHGALSNKAGVKKTLAMLKRLKAKVEDAIANQMSEEVFLASEPTKEFGDEFGSRGKSFAAALFKQLSAK